MHSSHARTEGTSPGAQPEASTLIPAAVSTRVLHLLERLADRLVARGVRANAITSWCVGLAFVAGLLLSVGWFALATVVMIVASLGDALDGLVARRGHTASDQGALMDAASDRYQEFFLFGGLALHLREWPFELGGALLALLGSFMLSYGGAKAEVLRAPVPGGRMRRPERATLLCLGTALTAVTSVIADRAGASHAIGVLPVVFVLWAIGLVANGSAVMRLRQVTDRLEDRDDDSGKRPRTPLLRLRCPR
jgi:CDP-diacylglycerol--glycerol-3-phosphate 3-phosphatidyltransferase